MKKNIILYTIWFYNNYICEDLSIYKKYAYYFIYPAWIVKSVLCWLFSPLFIPHYIYSQSLLGRYLRYILFIEYKSINNKYNIKN